MKTKSLSSNHSLWNRLLSALMLAVLIIVALPAAEVSAAVTGFHQPSTAVMNGRNAWLTPQNVFNSDNVYTSTSTKKKQLKLGGFNITPIPGNSAIDGIEVTVEGYQTSGRQLEVQLSWDGGKVWTTYKPQTSLGTTDGVYTLGGPGVTWNRTWQAYEFTNLNFKVRLVPLNGTGTIYVDQVLVKVYFTPTNTTVTVNKATALYGETSVTLGATLTETVGGAPIGGANLTFKLNGTTLGTVVTDGAGYASITASLSGLNAGLYQDAIWVDYLGGGSYQATYGINDLEIDGALVIVQPDAIYKTYGASDPTLTFQIVYVEPTVPPTVIDESDLTGALAREAGEDVDDYLISQGTLAAPLGIVLQVLETEFLTINPATIDVTTANYTKSPYEAAITSFAPIYSGFQLGDTAADLLTPATCTVAEAFQSVQGDYTIQCSGATALNYVFTYNGGTLTVTAAYDPLQNVYSTGTEDGWIREGTEFSGKGRRINTTATTLRVGDDFLNRQYKSVLSFNGVSVPDFAMIKSVKLQVVYQGKKGNAFRSLKNLYVDMSAPTFGTTILEKTDFKAPASMLMAGIISKVQVAPGVYEATLSQAAVDWLNNFDQTNPGGLTQLQLRLRFQRQDDNDFISDFLKFYSGDSTLPGSQPVLIIEYMDSP